MNIPVGVSDFTEIRQNGYYYVDKTGLICALLRTTATKVTLITRPIRFGKTLGMSMLASFFDIRRDSEPLFYGLEIAQEKALCAQWMNQWPVIFISFKSVDGRNFSGAYDMLRLAVAGVFKQHLYLADSDRINAYDLEIFLRIAQGSASESEIKNSLTLLTHMLHSH